VVRQSGYSLTRLAQSLGISRNTLYNRFDNPHLGYRFILDVGNAIHYDFTHEFPEMKETIETGGEGPIPSIDRGTAELLRIKGKYIDLLERYTKLQSILVRLANENELQVLKQEILKFIEEGGV
ncbi:MAG: hypothetical protein AAF392_01995, partial [Bacteroidota bacterium]